MWLAACDLWLLATAFSSENSLPGLYIALTWNSITFQVSEYIADLMEQMFEMEDVMERLMFVCYGGKAAYQRRLGPFDRADKLCRTSGASVAGQQNISAYWRELLKLGKLDAAHQELLGKLKTLSTSQADSPAVRLRKLDVWQMEQYIQSATRFLLRVTDHFPSICDVNANPETILAKWKYEGNPPVDALFGAAVWLFGTLLQTLVLTWGILADYISLKVYSVTSLITRDTLTEVQPELNSYYKLLTGPLKIVEDVLQTWCHDAQHWRKLVYQHTDQPMHETHAGNESVWQKTVKALHDCKVIGEVLFAPSNTATPEMKDIAKMYSVQQTRMLFGQYYLLEIRREVMLLSGDLQFFQITNSDDDVDSAIQNAVDVADRLCEFSKTLYRSHLERLEK